MAPNGAALLQLSVSRAREAVRNLSSKSALADGEPPMYFVHATKAGEVPLFVEKSKWNKLITRCEHCAGDVQALATALKQALGTGGTMDGSAIIIQGDQREALTAWLLSRGLVRGLRSDKLSEKHEKGDAPEEVAAPVLRERKKPRWTTGDKAAAAARASNEQSDGDGADEPDEPDEPDDGEGGADNDALEGGVSSRSREASSRRSLAELQDDDVEALVSVDKRSITDKKGYKKFVRLMMSWPYWSCEYSQLPCLWQRHQVMPPIASDETS